MPAEIEEEFKIESLPASNEQELDECEFRAVISHRSSKLLSIALCVELQQTQTVMLTRPLLGAILMEAVQLEELLDAFGAESNSTWFPYRELIAAAKNFTDAGYKLLHLQHSMPRYDLNLVNSDLVNDTVKSMDLVAEILSCALLQLLRKGRALGLQIPLHAPALEDFRESLPRGSLPRDRTSRRQSSVAERVVHVATLFLDLTVESDFLRTAISTPPPNAADIIPDPINEASFRQLEYKFHNLQSMYDTYIFDSTSERTDPDLRRLRSYISVIFHLLEMGTLVVHFYERHVQEPNTEETIRRECPIDFDWLLAALLQYSLANAVAYIQNGRELCHAMLQRYATVTSVAVPVPKYRGFHVRPSTLIAQIVRHYGSEVSMRLGAEKYDAGSALDLFRANEFINAEKRKRLANELAGIKLNNGQTRADPVAVVHNIVQQLADQKKLLIYEKPLPVAELKPRARETVGQFVIEEITRLMAMGKIDIVADLTATFRGDERVLNDLQILAANSYCEDLYGHNIPIPPELGYLRR